MNIIYILLFIPSIAVAPMSFVLSEGIQGFIIKKWLFILGMLGFPVVILASIILSNMFYSSDEYKLAKIFLYLPVFWIAWTFLLLTFSLWDIWQYFTCNYGCWWNL